MLTKKQTVINKALLDQIPGLWEVIKFVSTTVDEVDEKDLPRHLNSLLHELLNEKAQCFVRYNLDDRNIHALFITKILKNNINGEKYLQVVNVYGFKGGENDTWKRDINFLKEFGRKESCSYMGFMSRNKRVWDIGKFMGFEEAFRTFRLRL